jgi:hypothetical protein
MDTFQYGFLSLHISLYPISQIYEFVKENHNEEENEGNYSEINVQ